MMRFATVRTSEGTSAARLDGDTLMLLDAPDVGSLLRSGLDAARETGERVSVDSVELAPVVTAPSKIICVGFNYKSHADEAEQEVPEYPALFAKFAPALIGARDDIVLPQVSVAMDWEVELALVIGNQCRGVEGDRALEAIAGYTIMNDVSARDWQRRTGQYLQGKTFDSTAPFGPYMVTGDEVDHARDLTIRCEINGQTMQDARTSHMIFDPVTVVSYISQIVTLMPGDVIATGTPGGIGARRNPKIFLKPGDVVTSTIEGLDSLRNICVSD